MDHIQLVQSLVQSQPLQEHQTHNSTPVIAAATELLKYDINKTESLQLECLRLDTLACSHRQWHNSDRRLVAFGL